jgi:methionyl-tRNA formyltransferase
MSNELNLRIIFAGTPDFAVPALQRLLARGFRPLAVLTQPDRPAGRGRRLQASPVNPIQRAIEAGDSETGVCIMQMDEGLDTGPVLHRVALPIGENETGGSLHDTLAEVGADALLSCIEALARGAPPDPVRQAEQGLSYARKLLKAEAQISWQEPARQLERRIRAFNPWPVAWCTINGERTRIWRAAHEKLDHDKEPGTVLRADKAGIEIATGEQMLRLLELQRPGGKRISAAQYLNSRSLPGRLDG